MGYLPKSRATKATLGLLFFMFVQLLVVLPILQAYPSDMAVFGWWWLAVFLCILPAAAALISSNSRLDP